MKSPASVPGASHSPQPYRADIDGLRALSVLAVLGFHAFPTTLQRGYLGVDVFFVISGYLISNIILGNLARSRFTFTDFYSRRVRRIFPSLLLVLAATWALGWFALFAQEYKFLGKHVFTGAAFLANFGFWIESGYFDHSGSVKPLLHLWSLGVEEQFYLFWPLLLLLGSRRARGLVPAVLGVTLLSAACYFLLPRAGTLDLQLAGRGLSLNEVFYSPLTRMWELGAGALLATLSRSESGKTVRLPGGLAPYRDLAAALGLALTLLALLLPERVVSPRWVNLLPVAGTSLLIAAGAGAWTNRRLLSGKLLVGIGLISYPLYLWHWPLLSYLNICENGDVPVAARAGALALSFLLAWATYSFAERPFREGLRQWYVVPCLLAAMALVAGIGLLTNLAKGFEKRSAVIEAQARKVPREPAFDATKVCPGPGEIPECVFLAQARAPTVALIGDSHASHLFYGLEPIFREKGENLLSMGSCMILEGVDSVLNGELETTCGPRRDAILAYLKRTPSIHTVILSFRGPLAATGKGFLLSDTMADKEPRSRELSMPDRPGLSGNEDIFKEALARTLRTLEGAGKKVIYAHDIPEIGFEPISCVQRPLRLLGSVERRPCALPREAYEARTAGYKKLAGSVLKDFPGVKVVSPAEALCDQHYCYAARGETFYYMDLHHLSFEGSLQVATAFRGL